MNQFTHKITLIGYYCLLLVCCLWMCGHVESASFISTIAGGGVCDGSQALQVTMATMQSSGLAMSQSGDIYFSDSDHNRVRKIFANGTVITVAGDGAGGDIGDASVIATSARLYRPAGIALNSKGEVIFADRQNHRIKKILNNGYIVTIAGLNSFGQGTENVPATQSKLNFPSGVAVDANDNVLIVDTNNSKLRKILSNGNIVTIAGGAVAGYSGDNGLATSAQLNQPSGVAISPLTNEIFISDQSNNVIRKIDTNGIISTFAGVGTGSSSGNNVDGLLAINARMTPLSISVNSIGEVFYTDAGTSNILKILTNGTVVLVAGGGTPAYNGDNMPATQTMFNYPGRVVFDPSNNGDFYVLDTGNYRVRKYSNGIITNIAGNGQRSYCGNNDMGPSAALDMPYGIAADSSNIYFSDANNHRIRKISSDGKISTFAGDGTYSNIVEDVAATDSSIYYPQGLCLTTEGDLIIAATNSQRLRRVFKSNGTIVTIAGTGQAGTQGDNGPAISAQLNSPTGIACFNNEIYIADKYSNKIRKIGADGIIVTVAGTGAGSFSGDGIATSVALKNPLGVAVDPNTGDLLISDSANNRIRRLFKVNNTLTTIAGTGGQFTSGDGGLAINAGVYGPKGISVDSKTGDIYFTEANRLRKISAATGIITTVVGTNGGGFNSDGPTLNAMLLSPTDVVIKPNNDIVIVDSGNGRIRKMFSVITCNNIQQSDSKVCSGHGTCASQDSCQCNAGYAGPNCEYPVCNSIPSNDITVCNGHGTCNGPDSCQCIPTYNGQYCDHLITTPGITCFGLAQNDPKVCSGRGSCVSSDVCKCSLSKYKGSDCSTEVVSLVGGVCFGLASNDSKVCSSHGLCVSNDTCSCDGNWGAVDCSTCLPSHTGSNCEQLISCSDGSCNKLYALFVLLAIPIIIIIIIVIIIIVVVVRKKKKSAAPNV